MCEGSIANRRVIFSFVLPVRRAARVLFSSRPLQQIGHRAVQIAVVADHEGIVLKRNWDASKSAEQLVGLRPWYGQRFRPEMHNAN